MYKLSPIINIIYEKKKKKIDVLVILFNQYSIFITIIFDLIVLRRYRVHKSRR